MSDLEQALVLKSQGGDRSAFEELVRRTSRLVFTRLYLGCGDAHRAEDLTQETFLLAWRSIRQVTDAQGFRSWLLQIAHNVETDARRRALRLKRRGTEQSNDAIEAIRDAAPGPADLVEQRERKDEVLSALRSMPEEYRLPLMLRYVSGADYETIGRELALSNGALRGLLHRGLKRLREMVGEE